MGGPEITVEQMSAALRTIAAWRVAPEAEAVCPLCGAKGLAISDHSARPHAEWYRLVCMECGLDQMLGVPLGTAVPGGDG
jgi:predicted RNA-binding Zn-ribbon protein involved in translation (DUF1610 family)